MKDNNRVAETGQTFPLPISKCSLLSYITGLAGRPVRINTIPRVLAASSVARSAATASVG